MKTTTNLLSFGAIAVDLEDRERGKIYLWLYNYKMKTENLPKLILTPTENGLWYKYFQDQIEILWDKAKDWPS